jgi:selenocysteine lyase/cysteine desulfurase
MKLDLDFVRQQFPAFSEPSLHDTVFVENAGGSYMCTQTISLLERYYRRCKVQPYHLNPVAQTAGVAMDAGHQALAPYLNVNANELYFGPSTSQNTHVLANAIWGYLQANDEIIVTNQDHEANSGAWRKLKDRGVVVREWAVDPTTGSLSLAKLEALLNDKTKLVIFPHCSNILGEINPVAQICDLAHQRGAKTIVDGVSFAGHGLPDVTALGADVYLFSLYKVYGPHQGVMVIRSEMAELFSSQAHYFNGDIREKRLMPAGPDHAQIAAAKGVSDYFDALYQHHFTVSKNGMEQAEAVRNLLHQAEQQTLSKLLDYLNQHPKVRIVGPTEATNRAPTISIIPSGQTPQSLVQSLGEVGILAGAGHFYSTRLLDAMGIDLTTGVARFSMVHYNSLDDVDRLIKALDSIL